MVGVLGQAARGEGAPHDLAALVRRDAAQRVRDVLRHGRHDDLRVRVGEHEPHAPSHRRALAARVEAVDEHASRRGHDEPVEQAGQGALARAVRPDHADPVLAQLEAHAAQDVALAEPHVHVLEPHHAPPAVSSTGPPVRAARPRPGGPGVAPARRAPRARSPCHLHEHRDALAAADGRRREPERPGPRAPRTSRENSRTTATAPLAPHGWPSASAPPSGHTRASSAGRPAGRGRARR